MAETLRPTTFYHGTSVEAAWSIQENGFDPERSGSNAGALLGKGVYCTTTLEKAMDYAKTKPAKGIIFQLRIDLGSCKKLQRGDPMMKSWQENGYDSAWAPGGANTRGLDENCVKDPARIQIVRAIAGDAYGSRGVRSKGCKASSALEDEESVEPGVKHDWGCW